MITCKIPPSESKASKRINIQSHAAPICRSSRPSDSSNFFRSKHCHDRSNSFHNKVPVQAKHPSVQPEMDQEPQQQQQQQQPEQQVEAKMGESSSSKTGGLVQGRPKRKRKLRLEVDWTLLLLPPSPKVQKKRKLLGKRKKFPRRDTKLEKQLQQPRRKKKNQDDGNDL